MSDPAMTAAGNGAAELPERALTAAEADAALRRLSRHFGERVAPVSRYCEALRSWAEVYRTYDARVYQAARLIKAALHKSNLAARLVYGGEVPRKTPCPVHKGRWSGCVWPDKSEDRCACMSGCNITGWLP